MEGEFQNTFFNKKLAELKFALDRVSHLPVHDALTIVRNALSLPRLMYFLRTSFSVDASILGGFDGALRASDEKFKKYEGALPSMDFLPVCIEVLGPMDNNTSIFFKKICKMISGRSGDSRELFFAMNHISCLLQRFLRVCVTENVQLNADNAIGDDDEDGNCDRKDDDGSGEIEDKNDEDADGRDDDNDNRGRCGRLGGVYV
ncbi:hypothetical protein HELRODRAFT_184641 [Helobdella robusta]|uniref:Uncharacterized protein n=1 Tax=Helobdella robusta TaxID=6412 RepID=T1FLN3_HELRO|nr:hypothetical protein HELRODRAFT_184641 [Helobdella robusta]ESO07853.1 hypothetical protein HELRODRAFT_184641 [Helobdella robusta]